MGTPRNTFHAALFLMAFVVCVLVAALTLGRKPRSTVPDFAEPVAATTAKPEVRPASPAAATPLPDQTVATETRAPADSPAPTLPPGLATPGVRTEADIDTGRAPGPITHAEVPKPLQTAEVDLPVVAPAELDAATPATAIVTAATTVDVGNTDRLRELPQGYVIGHNGVRPVQQTDITPAHTPIEMQDLSGGQNDFSTSRVEQIIRRYSDDDLPPPVKTPPPIAVPEGLRPRIFTPTPTPTLRQRMRNVPTNLIQTRMPILTNMMPTTDSLEPVSTPMLPSTDAGSVAPNTLFEDPRKRSQQRIQEHMQASQAVGIIVPSPVPSGIVSPVTATAAVTPQVTPGATPEATPRMAEAVPTTGTYTIRQGKAEVTFSNVPPGWLRPDAQPDVVTPPPALPSPSAVHPNASPKSGVISNAADSPSPTPNYSTGVETALGTPAGRFALPPAPTLKPPLMQEDTPRPKDGTRTTPSSLPPEIAKRLGATPGVLASVGERNLSADDVRRRIDVALSLKGERGSSEQRDALEKVVASEWAERTAVAEEARRQGLSVTNEEVAAHAKRLAERSGTNLEEVLRRSGFTENEIESEIRESALCEKLVDTAFGRYFSTEERLREVYQQDPSRYSQSGGQASFEQARPMVIAAIREYLQQACYETAKLHSQVRIGNRVQKSIARPEKEDFGPKSFAERESARRSTEAMPDQSTPRRTPAATDGGVRITPPAEATPDPGAGVPGFSGPIESLGTNRARR